MQGLVTLDRGDKLAEHKVYFARDDNKGRQLQSLSRIIDFVKPTILMGLSTIGGAFTGEIITKMAQFNDRPIIFPLSNPSSKSECNFDEAVKGTNGKVIFASGSPFPSAEWQGKTLTPGQGNNMYVFPGIGLAAILCKAVNVTQEMIYASGLGLAASLSPDEHAAGWIYPEISRIRDVSVVVARYVMRAAQRDGVDRELNLRPLADAELDEYIRERMYDPFNQRDALVTEVHGLLGRQAAFSNGNGNGHL